MDNLYGEEQFKKLITESLKNGLTGEEFLERIEADADKWLNGLSEDLVMKYLKEIEREK